MGGRSLDSNLDYRDGKGGDSGEGLVVVVGGWWWLENGGGVGVVLGLDRGLMCSSWLNWALDLDFVFGPLLDSYFLIFFSFKFYVFLLEGCSFSFLKSPYQHMVGLGGLYLGLCTQCPLSALASHLHDKMNATS